MDLQSDGLRTLGSLSVVPKLIKLFLRKLLEDVDEPMSNFELSLMLEVSVADKSTVDSLALSLRTTKVAVSAAVNRLEELRLLCREKEGDGSDLVSLSEDGQVLMSRIASSFFNKKDDWLSELHSSGITLVLSVLLGQNQAN